MAFEPVSWKSLRRVFAPIGPFIQLTLRIFLANDYPEDTATSMMLIHWLIVFCTSRRLLSIMTCKLKLRYRVSYSYQQRVEPQSKQ